MCSTAQNQESTDARVDDAAQWCGSSPGHGASLSTTRKRMELSVSISSISTREQRSSDDTDSYAKGTHRQQQQQQQQAAVHTWPMATRAVVPCGLPYAWRIPVCHAM